MKSLCQDTNNIAGEDLRCALSTKTVPLRVPAILKTGDSQPMSRTQISWFASSYTTPGNIKPPTILLGYLCLATAMSVNPRQESNAAPDAETGISNSGIGVGFLSSAQGRMKSDEQQVLFATAGMNPNRSSWSSSRSLVALTAGVVLGVALWL